ncbi:Uncharacterised protein [Bordetella pertussis]|nr:Uncharacterised protein [Bordetella pertussis]CFW32320.1 Uncharacterised protein [Bordetella pertussis]
MVSCALKSVSYTLNTSSATGSAPRAFRRCSTLSPPLLPYSSDWRISATRLALRWSSA